MHLENPEAIKLPEFCVVSYQTVDTILDYLAAHTNNFDRVTTRETRADLAWQPYEGITYSIPGHESIIYTEGLADCTSLITMDTESSAISHLALNYFLRHPNSYVNKYQLERVENFRRFQRKLDKPTNIFTGTNIPNEKRREVKDFLKGKVEGDIDTDYVSILTDATQLFSPNYTQHMIHGVYIIPAQLSVDAKTHLAFTVNDHSVYHGDGINDLTAILSGRNRSLY